MNMFVNMPEYPPATFRAVVPEFRYLVFQRLAGSQQRTDDRFCSGHALPLLHAADARHVDRRVRVSRIAHDWNASRQFCRGATRLTGDAA
jgi:hypothetical protein